QNNAPVGLDDCLARLPGAPARYSVLVDMLVATGIDDEERTVGRPSLAIVAITRKARKIGNQCRPGTRQAIEQRGLPHVGPAHQGDNRLEKGRVQFTPTKTRLPLPV